MPPIKFLDFQLDHKGIIFLSNPYLYSISLSNWGFENAMLITSPVQLHAVLHFRLVTL